MTRFVDKRAIVTGSVANIGRAAASRLAAEGAEVVLVDRDPAVKETAAQIIDAGGRAYALIADVGDESEVADVVSSAIDQLGGLDVVINNAGIQRSGAIEDTALTDWDQTLRINAGSCYLFAKYTVAHLRSAGGGAIVNTSSVAGVRGGPPSLSAYSASKGAIIAFTKVLAKEVGQWNIRANALCPGWIDTAFNGPVIDYLGGDAAVEASVAGGVCLRRQGTPAEAAAVMLFLASDDASYLTGQAIVVDGGTM